MLLTPLLGGCNLVWKYFRAGELKAVQPASDRPRVGNVYLVRGWIGIFSFGMDKLSDKLEEAGIRALVFQDAQHSDLAEQISKVYRQTTDHEPIVLIGHSYGADDVVRIARHLNNAGIYVDMLVTIDPVVPGQVPPNVRRTVNIFRSNGVFDTMPWLRGIPLKLELAGSGELANVDIRTDRPDLMEPGTDHFTIDKNEKVQEEILKRVMEVCPPRENWAATGDAHGAEGG